MTDTYKSVCDKCGHKTWYEIEQPCKMSYPARCKECGHALDRQVKCTGTLRLIDNSSLDARLTPYYESGERVEITWRPGYEDHTGYGNRTDGRKARGYIGKSTGRRPIYLLILKANSYGGGAICSEGIESIRSLGVTR